MLARLYDAVWHSRERKKAKLRNILKRGDDITTTIERIMELFDVKKS